MKLQLCCAYGAKCITLPLAIVVLCLFGLALSGHSGIFREFQVALLSLQWMLLVCLAVWCGTFLFLTFSRKDLPLVGLLLIAIVLYYINYAASSRATDAIIFLAGMTVGRGARFALMGDGRWKIGDRENSFEIVDRKSAIVNFLLGLIVLLAFSAWWHLETPGYYYQGSRWTGLWDNPNIYGML